MKPTNNLLFSLEFLILPDVVLFLVMIAVYIGCFPLPLPFSKKRVVAWSFLLTFIIYFCQVFIHESSHISLIYSLLGLPVLVSGLLFSKRLKQHFGASLYLMITLMMLFVFQLKASWITVTGLACFYLLAKVFHHFELFDDHKEPYVLTIEIKDVSRIDELSVLFDAYNLTIIEKKLVKSHHTHLTIRYFAPRLVQHLLLKRLYRLSHLGSIVTI